MGSTTKLPAYKHTYALPRHFLSGIGIERRKLMMGAVVALIALPAFLSAVDACEAIRYAQKIRKMK